MSQGDYLPVIMSSGCPDCQDAVEPLNEVSLLLETPQVIGFMFGDDEEYEDFLAITDPLFPTKIIDGLTFFELIDKEPPRFYYTHDGKTLGFFDDLEVNTDKLLEFIESGGLPPTSTKSSG